MNTYTRKYEPKIMNAQTYSELCNVIKSSIEDKTFLHIQPIIKKFLSAEWVKSHESDKGFSELLHLLAIRASFIDVRDPSLPYLEGLLRTLSTNVAQCDHIFGLPGRDIVVIQKYANVVIGKTRNVNIKSVSESAIMDMLDYGFMEMGEDRPNTYTDKQIDIARDVLGLHATELKNIDKRTFDLADNLVYMAAEKARYMSPATIYNNEMMLSLITELDSMISKVIANGKSIREKDPLFDALLSTVVYNLSADLRFYYCSDIAGSIEKANIRDFDILMKLNDHSNALHSMLSDPLQICLVMNYCNTKISKFMNIAASNSCEFLTDAIAFIVNSYCIKQPAKPLLDQRYYLIRMSYLVNDPLYAHLAAGETASDIFEKYLTGRALNVENIFMEGMFDYSDIVIEAETSDEEEEPEDDNESEDSDVEIEATQSNKGYKKGSKSLSDGERKVYRMFKKYKNAEDKVDSQLSKLVMDIKNAIKGDKTNEILGDDTLSVAKILKRILKTGAIFSFSKVGAILYLITGPYFNKKATEKQRKEILATIEAEIEILEEKIEDAKSDGNREAKYAMMRTRTELVKAKEKVKYGLTATNKAIDTAKGIISKSRKRR